MTASSDPHAITVTEVEGNVRAELRGVLIAESSDVLVLREGSLTPRYYFPREHVQMEHLERTDTSTTCPFKGDASYWSAVLEDGHRADDVVWSYEDPIESMTVIAHRLCFYNDRVALLIDGRPLELPTG
ncbi:MAG: DUF427 domain-containing protein [Acidimicrobiia bacterium]